MDAETNAKLKHLGSSIDAVRHDVCEIRDDVRELRKEEKDQTLQIAGIQASVSAHDAELTATKRDVRDIRALVWKIVAALAAAGLAVDKFFH